MPSAARRPVGFAVLTISDTRTLDSDTSGAYLADALTTVGHELIGRRLVADEPERIEAALTQWMADERIEAVLTTGGTGITGRDSTPEVMGALITKEIPGFGELFRLLSYEEIGTSTIQSRSLGGLAGTTLLFALPGSPGACRLAWTKILAAQFDIDTRPCNFVELLPRLEE